MIPSSNYSSISIPEELLSILQKTGIGKSLDDKIRNTLAISLFLDKTVTLEKAAELSGKPLANFIEILQSKGIPWMDYTEDNIDEDDFAVKKYFEEKSRDDE
jgi:predicted HTH domain antitoxin